MEDFEFGGVKRVRSAECEVRNELNNNGEYEMKHDNLKDRTKSFALRVIRMVEGLPKIKLHSALRTPH